LSHISSAVRTKFKFLIYLINHIEQTKIFSPVQKNFLKDKKGNNENICWKNKIWKKYNKITNNNDKY